MEPEQKMRDTGWLQRADAEIEISAVVLGYKLKEEIRYR
jgi:hypothetical protein